MKILYKQLTKQIKRPKSNGQKLKEQQKLFFAALNKIAEVIVRTKNTDVLLEKVNCIIGETLKSDHALIFHVSFDEKKVKKFSEWWKKEHPLARNTKDEYSLHWFKKSITYILNKKTHLISHFSNLNAHFLDHSSGKLLHKHYKIKSLIWYPFDFDNNSFYVFSFNEFLNERKWTSEEISFIDSAAQQVSIALMKHKLHKERNVLRKRIKEMECIQKLSYLIDKHDNVDDILQELIFILKNSCINPEQTEVRITHKGMVYETNSIKPHTQILAADIKGNDYIIGKIELSLVANFNNEPKYIDGRKKILRIVAERISKTIQRLENTKRYEELFETLYEAVIRTNENRIITDANNAAANLCGFESKEELCGKNIKDIYAQPIIRDNVIERLKSNGNAVQNFEFELRRKDGTTIPVLGNINMLFGRNGEFAGTLGAIRDISKLKKAEKALIESEKKYRVLIENIGEGVGAVDENEMFLFANSEAERIFGTNKGELIGKSLKEFLSSQNYNFILNQTQKRKRGQKNTYLVEITKKNKTTVPIIVTATPFFNEEGKFTSTYAVFRDISERIKAEEQLKISQEKYKRLTENAQDIIYRMSVPDGKYEYVSPASMQITGYSPSEFYDNPFLIKSFIHPDYHYFFKDEWNRIINGSISSFFEFKILDKEKNEKWLYQRNVLIKNDNGKPIAIEGIVSDITDRKNAEIKIKQREIRLKSLVNIFQKNFDNKQNIRLF